MYNLNTSNFRQLLTEYRKSRGFTLESLGKKIGKTKATISKYENGEIIPDILTILEICNTLNITLTQLFPSIYINNVKKTSKNPFNTNKLYLYYYTENILITSVLELKETNNEILVNFYNGIKNLTNYAKETSYYYEGILECDKNIGYINLCNTSSHETILEKIQISFVIPWSQNFQLTNFFILALTPNSIPIIKKGIISTLPLSSTSPYLEILKISKKDLEKIQENNAWILENKNYDYFFFN